MSPRLQSLTEHNELRHASILLDRKEARVTVIPIGNGDKAESSYGATDRLQDEVVTAIKAEDAEPARGINPYFADADAIRIMLGGIRDMVRTMTYVLDTMPAERKVHMHREIADITNTCGEIVSKVLKGNGTEWHAPLVSSFDGCKIVSEGGYGPRSYAARQST